MTDRTQWDPEDDQGRAITNLIEAGAMRLCPRCQYVPEDTDETIFEPLGITTRTVRQYVGGRESWDDIAVSVFTLVCAHCGYLIEHCLDYLGAHRFPPSWEDALYVGLGVDPEYDVLHQVAKLCESDGVE
jgi:hypothetical protein